MRHRFCTWFGEFKNDRSTEDHHNVWVLDFIPLTLGLSSLHSGSHCSSTLSSGTRPLRGRLYLAVRLRSPRSLRRNAWFVPCLNLKRSFFGQHSLGDTICVPHIREFRNGEALEGRRNRRLLAPPRHGTSQRLSRHLRRRECRFPTAWASGAPWPATLAS